MRYIPNTEEDLGRMLEAIGVQSIDDLFAQIPEELRLNRPLDLPPALAEPELMRHLGELAGSNRDATRTLSFLGAGVYHHASPTAVDSLVRRGEFFTAYTPYQPELAQGTLQTIFEFQTMVAELLGTEIANASLYDGSTGTAEAILMARRVTRRDVAVVSTAVHPEYREVVRTYLQGIGDPEGADPTVRDLREVGFTAAGTTDLAALEATLDDQTAAVVVQHPNFFGCLEDLDAIAALAHARGALLVVVNTDPSAFGVLEAPGAYDADIVVAEGQALGVPMSYGGPHVGLFGTRSKFVRQVPGRLCGQTVDVDGQTGYVLTLTTREQHIRREKATSNICTNQGLVALQVCIYLSLMGPAGLERVARTGAAHAHRFRERVAALPGFGELFPGSSIYHEVAVRTPGPATQVVERLLAEGIAAGVPLSRFYAGMEHGLLVNFTELHSEADVERLLAALARM